jgi:hypothetical protein
VKTHVEFSSDAFPALPGEEAQINPGRWGRLLADYLRAELSARGFRGKAPYCEDWGWAVPIENAGFPLWIGCGNLEDGATFGVAAPAPAPSHDQFVCFIEPSKPSVRRLFRRIDTAARVEALAGALDASLRQHPSIRDIRWLDHPGTTTSNQRLERP